MHEFEAKTNKIKYERKLTLVVTHISLDIKLNIKTSAEVITLHTVPVRVIAPLLNSIQLFESILNMSEKCRVFPSYIHPSACPLSRILSSPMY